MAAVLEGRPDISGRTRRDARMGEELTPKVRVLTDHRPDAFPWECLHVEVAFPDRCARAPRSSLSCPARSASQISTARPDLYLPRGGRGNLGLMTSGQQMKNDCEARLRASIADEEPVVAVGTADEFPQASGDLGVQGHWRFLLVTTRRLLFADWSKPDAPHEEIAFNAVAEWSDGTQYHRYVMTLKHPPMTREEWVPARKFLWFEWGNAAAPRTRTTTTPSGSAAAKAARPTLSARLCMNEASLTKRWRSPRFRVRIEPGEATLSSTASSPGSPLTSSREESQTDEGKSIRLES
jgi:hypothetical protein